jgi:hypothetical protein
VLATQTDNPALTQRFVRPDTTLGSSPRAWSAPLPACSLEGQGAHRRSPINGSAEIIAWAKSHPPAEGW